jgi:hypothetical protein
MRRLRVLSEHPHLGRPNDIVREVPHAQAYVDAGLCEWYGPEEHAPGPSELVMVDRSQTIETTDGAAVETTSSRVSPETTASRPGSSTTSSRRKL